MKIFSSFDTNFKNEIIKKEKAKYGDKHFKVISYWEYYYYFFILLPLIFLSLMTIAYLIIFFMIGSYISTDFKSIYYPIWSIFLIIVLLIYWFKILKKYIDYTSDFLVVTPDNLIHYDQEGVFSRKWRTIDLSKVKTITVEKKWLLRSIFNFWNIVVLTEGDEKWSGEIIMHYISNPDKVKQWIFKIMNLKPEERE